MADQMLMPMTINEITVNGAKNIRRGFLDPIFAPLLSGGPGAPSTIGDVMAKLQIASSKLSGLRAFVKCLSMANNPVINNPQKSLENHQRCTFHKPARSIPRLVQATSTYPLD